MHRVRHARSTNTARSPGAAFAAALSIHILAACSSAPTPPFAGRRPTRQEAAEWFASRGAQPGDRLPKLAVTDVEGRPVDVDVLAAGRPLVLATCSLTCNIARQQQAAIAAMRRRFGDRVAFALVYTIEAHPSGDPCPYTGEEWVPPANTADGVLVRQPGTLADRCVLARRFATDWAEGTPVLVDTMDDAAWRALGEAPHVGLCVRGDGIVMARTPWFDAAKIEAAADLALRER